MCYNLDESNMIEYVIDTYTKLTIGIQSNHEQINDTRKVVLASDKLELLKIYLTLEHNNETIEYLHGMIMNIHMAKTIQTLIRIILQVYMKSQKNKVHSSNQLFTHNKEQSNRNQTAN